MSPIFSMQLLRNLILVLPQAVETKTVLGIHLAPRDPDKPNTGEIKFAGPNVEVLKVGDIVTFSQYAGTEIVYEGVSYKLLLETDVYFKKL